MFHIAGISSPGSVCDFTRPFTMPLIFHVVGPSTTDSCRMISAEFRPTDLLDSHEWYLFNSRFNYMGIGSNLHGIMQVRVSVK